MLKQEKFRTNVWEPSAASHNFKPINQIEREKWLYYKKSLFLGRKTLRPGGPLSAPSFIGRKIICHHTSSSFSNRNSHLYH